MLANKRLSPSILSAKSSKTLYRPKMTSNSHNQINNFSIQSNQNNCSKQTKTFRHQNKNKSCYIPKHLAQSTESHLVSCSQERLSNEKMNGRSTGKNYSTERIRAKENVMGNNRVRENITRQSQDIMYSKMTVPYQRLVLNGQHKIQYSCNPSSNNQLNNFTTTNNIEPTNNPYIQILNKNLISNPQTNKPSIIKQKLLQKQVNEMLLYKNKELTKVLEEMHRFCICVKELKWICQQVKELVKKYNQRVVTYYEDIFGKQTKKRFADIQNIMKQAEQLFNRFSQLQYLKENDHNLVNFNLFETLYNPNANNIQNITNMIPNIKDSNPTQQSPTQNYDFANQSPQHNSSPHSWSKLIENIQRQQNPCQNISSNKAFYNKSQLPLIPEETKNFTIRTFQLTQQNSPMKNKTLNELIRLSQLRKTQYRSNTNDNKQNLNDNNNCYNNQPQNNAFIKKHYRQSLQQSAQLSDSKDPFDSIHLPHFNTKPSNNIYKESNNKINDLAQQRRLQYESQIRQLNRQIENLDNQNNEYFRKLRTKNQQLENAAEEMKAKLMKFEEFQKQVYVLVQDVISELIASTKSRDVINMPLVSINNQSFLNLINTLERILKLNHKNSHITAQIGQQNANIKSNSINTHKNQANLSNCLPQGQLYSIDLTQMRQSKQTLVKQITSLQQTKDHLKWQLSQLERQFNLLKNRINSISQNTKTSQQDYEFQQMLFLQAFTIQEMLERNQCSEENNEIDYEQ